MPLNFSVLTAVAKKMQKQGKNVDAKIKAEPQIMILLGGEWWQKGIYCETKSSIISYI